MKLFKKNQKLSIQKSSQNRDALKKLLPIIMIFLMILFAFIQGKNGNMSICVLNIVLASILFGLTFLEIQKECKSKENKLNNQEIQSNKLDL